MDAAAAESTAVSAVANVAAAPAAAYSEEDAAHCQSVAKQRSQDASVNGYEEDMQKQIFNGTYQTCMTWVAQHR